jgi:hypothetical protein
MNGGKVCLHSLVENGTLVENWIALWCYKARSKENIEGLKRQFDDAFAASFLRLKRANCMRPETPSLPKMRVR